MAMSALADRPTPKIDKNRPFSVRQVLNDWDGEPVAVDLIGKLLGEYDDLVECLVAPDASALRMEYAYGRLLGVRGSLCRLCPVGATELLPRSIVSRWNHAEQLLRDYLSETARQSNVQDVVLKVEEAWVASADSYLEALVFQMRNAEIQRQLGLLKSIDTVAMHLAQREFFRRQKCLKLPLHSAHAIKLRTRLLALYMMLHSTYFETSFPVLASYRETFRIKDPAAYPWWFVDHRLTERQLAWTYHRLDSSELDWRF